MYIKHHMEHAATPFATENYFRWTEIHPQKRRFFDTLSVSAIGCGTCLGAADDVVDKLYEQNLVKAGMRGINFFDTAINYRCMRSEKVLGRVIKQLASQGVMRDQLVLSTKGGYIPCEGSLEQFEDYARIHYLDTGLVEPSEIVAGCHCLAPAFLEQQISLSLGNLNLQCIDLYFLHNPEMQLQEIEEEKFYQRLTKAFQLLEQQVQKGTIKRYGIASWNGFRQKLGLKGTLQVSRILACAREAGGEHHHFKAIQAPYNLVMLEVIKSKNQQQGEEKKTLAQILQEHNIAFLASASLMQSQILRIQSRLFDRLPPQETHALQALQFVASTSLLCTAFVGMKRWEHLEENSKLLHLPNWTKEEWAIACTALGIESFAP